MTAPINDRLGCYVLPGAARDPREGVEQAQLAQKYGAGSIWVGERYDSKDLPSLAGALSQVTTDVRIGAAVTHTGLRHPMVLASMGQTLQSLTNGRFRIGFGRSAPWRWNAYGVPAPRLRTLRDNATILRQLWAGETVEYHGPLGTFPRLKLAQYLDLPAPELLLAAVGPRTLELAGEAYDGVVLHPILTPAGVRNSVRMMRDAAERAGRDPSTIRCIATVVVAPDASADRVALQVNARAAGYLSLRGLGDAIAAINGWSATELERYREQPLLKELDGLPADKNLSRQQLIDLTEALPSDWLPSASATGSSAECVATLRSYLEAGADEIILHGADPSMLELLLAEAGAGR